MPMTYLRKVGGSIMLAVAPPGQDCLTLMRGQDRSVCKGRATHRRPADKAVLHDGRLADGRRLHSG
jgi:hypothetical protein